MNWLTRITDQKILEGTNEVKKYNAGNKLIKNVKERKKIQNSVKWCRWGSNLSLSGASKEALANNAAKFDNSNEHKFSCNVVTHFGDICTHPGLYRSASVC